MPIWGRGHMTLWQPWLAPLNAFLLHLWKSLTNANPALPEASPRTYGCFLANVTQQKSGIRLLGMKDMRRGSFLLCHYYNGMVMKLRWLSSNIRGVSKDSQRSWLTVCQKTQIRWLTVWHLWDAEPNLELPVPRLLGETCILGCFWPGILHFVACSLKRPDTGQMPFSSWVSYFSQQHCHIPSPSLQKPLCHLWASSCHSIIINLTGSQGQVHWFQDIKAKHKQQSKVNNV